MSPLCMLLQHLIAILEDAQAGVSKVLRRRFVEGALKSRIATVPTEQMIRKALNQGFELSHTYSAERHTDADAFGRGQNVPIAKGSCSTLHPLRRGCVRLCRRSLHSGGSVQGLRKRAQDVDLTNYQALQNLQLPIEACEMAITH